MSFVHSSLVKVVALLLGSLASQSCKSNFKPVSKAKFAPIDPSADNYALIFGAPNDLKGVATDVSEMEKLLRSSSYGYNVVANPSASRAEILSTLQRYSSTISEKGTLLLYFSGHGTQNGDFVTQEANIVSRNDVENPGNKPDAQVTVVSHNDVLEAIRTGRISNGEIRPVRFLITIVDSCFSGHWTDSSEELGTDSFEGSVRLAGKRSLGLTANTKGFSKKSTTSVRELGQNMLSQNVQALQTAASRVIRNSGERFLANYLTVTSASATESAIDDGATNGGRFTYQLRRGFDAARNSGQPYTFNQWLEQTRANVLPDHHVSYVASNPNILAIDLFSTDRPRINDSNQRIPANLFDFSVSTFMDANQAKFRISNIVNCPSDKITWTVKLVTGESCSLQGGSCAFKSGIADVTQVFPEPRRDFDVTGTCGTIKPVTYRVKLSTGAADDDQDGVPNAVDRCARTKSGLAVERTGRRAGCASDQFPLAEDGDQDGVPNSADRCFYSPEGATVDKTDGPRKGCAANEMPAGPDLPPADQDGVLSP
jgi:hypothetical protein